MDMLREALTKYRETLAEDRRVLLDRYRLVDAAIKVVGIGSVGTLRMVALMMSDADSPLFLQVKQANASVLEAYAGKSVYAQHGERVVQGQRLMQPASDSFLGWVIGPESRHFYLRQLRDVTLAAGRDLRCRDAVDLWQGVRLGPGPRACQGRRSLGNQRVPWEERPVRRGDGQIRARLCRPAERDHAALKAAVRAGVVDVQLEH
jgi:Uncharacterized protein conserved in bacteria (DUF2252)